MRFPAVMIPDPKKATRWEPVVNNFPGRHRQVPDDATLLAARDAGWTIAGMSAKWKLAPATLRNHFVRLKAALPDGRIKREARRDRGEVRGRRKGPSDQILIADRLAGKSISDMAASYGLAEKTVRNYLTPLGLGKSPVSQRTVAEAALPPEVVAQPELATSAANTNVGKSGTEDRHLWLAKTRQRRKSKQRSVAVETLAREALRHGLLLAGLGGGASVARHVDQIVQRSIMVAAVIKASGVEIETALRIIGAVERSCEAA